MKITRSEIENYRNIENMEFSPCDGVNIIYGDNAQGKTNLMEALWLFTGAKSFRGGSDHELIRFDAPAARLSLQFEKDGREQCAGISIPQKSRKEVHLNFVPLPSQSALAGEIYAVVFSPVHLSLVKDGPEVRRRFLDLAICQLMPRYVDILSRYNRILRQRNALLKELRFGNISYGPQTLEVFDDALSKTAVSVIRARQRYISRLAQAAGDIYQGISRENETMTLRYLSGIPPLEELSSQQILSHLRQNRQADIAAAATLYGPHRDDLGIDIDHNAARSFGSQGQQRSCILSLKLAESIIIEETTGQSPIILLDDVMSELDRSRRDYLLNHLQGKQVFITCCETAYFQTLEQGRCFLIGEGSIRQTFDLCRAQRDETPQDSL